MLSKSSDIRNEVNQLLVNWNGEDEPFVCPGNIQNLAMILRIDLSQKCSPRVIRILKDALRKLALERNMAEETMKLAIEYVNSDRSFVGEESLSSPSFQGSDRMDIKIFSKGGFSCVECEKVCAIHYCLVCFDFLCDSCSLRIHRKGQRRLHKLFSLSRCENVDNCTRPASVECPITRKRFCASCYTEIYLPTVPLHQRSGAPALINYASEWNSLHVDEGIGIDSLKNCDVQNDWYPFNDRYGVIFYYNFKTEESQRRAPGSVFDDSNDSIICDEQSDVSERIDCLPLRSFNLPSF